MSNFSQQLITCHFCNSKYPIINSTSLGNSIYYLHGPVRIKDFYPKVSKQLSVKPMCFNCSTHFRIKPDEFLFKYDLGLL